MRNLMMKVVLMVEIQLVKSRELMMEGYASSSTFNGSLAKAREQTCSKNYHPITEKKGYHVH
jgi:hypothetical protein